MNIYTLNEKVLQNLQLWITCLVKTAYDILESEPNVCPEPAEY